MLRETADIGVSSAASHLGCENRTGPEAVSESVRCYHVALSKYDSYSTYD